MFFLWPPLQSLLSIPLVRKIEINKLPELFVSVSLSSHFFVTIFLFYLFYLSCLCLTVKMKRLVGGTVFIIQGIQFFMRISVLEKQQHFISASSVQYVFSKVRLRSKWNWFIYYIDIKLFRFKNKFNLVGFIDTLLFKLDHWRKNRLKIIIFLFFNLMLLKNMLLYLVLYAFLRTIWDTFKNTVRLHLV